MLAACSAGVPAGSAGMGARSPLPMGAAPTPGPVCGYTLPSPRARVVRVMGTASGLAVMPAWIWLTAA